METSSEIDRTTGLLVEDPWELVLDQRRLADVTEITMHFTVGVPPPAKRRDTAAHGYGYLLPRRGRSTHSARPL
jgi:hypothetical protein